MMGLWKAVHASPACSASSNPPGRAPRAGAETLALLQGRTGQRTHVPDVPSLGIPDQYLSHPPRTMRPLPPPSLSTGDPIRDTREHVAKGPALCQVQSPMSTHLGADCACPSLSNGTGMTRGGREASSRGTKPPLNQEMAGDDEEALQRSMEPSLHRRSHQRPGAQLSQPAFRLALADGSVHRDRTRSHPRQLRLSRERIPVEYARTVATSPAKSTSERIAL